MKRKINWKNIIGLGFLASLLILTLNDLARIFTVSSDKFDNKILLIGQITAGLIFLLIYLIGKTGKLIEKKENDKETKETGKQREVETQKKKQKETKK